jgi:general secretion pathway protein J
MTSREHGFTPVRRSAEHGFTPVRRSAEHGFTLVEVMVALLIFGMIAAAGVAILSFSVRSQAATGARLDDAAALGRTESILSADLAQAVNRPVRDEGGTTRPAFVGDAAGFTLVRLGWSNVDAAPRPTAQKVGWRLVAGALERVAYPMLDGAAPLPPAALLTRVRQARLRYRFRGAWSDRWDGATGVPLPDAAELSLVRDDGTIWRTMALVGTGYTGTPDG